MSSRLKEKKGWSLKNMIKEIVTSIVILFLISILINYIRKPDIRENIYALELEDIEHKKIDFRSYRGKPLLIHFWGTWCPICRLEATNIEHVAKSYNVISIAVKSESNEQLNHFMQEHQLSYRVVNDKHGQLAKKFNIEAYPTTLMYNGKGELKFTEVGYSTTLGLEARMEFIN